MDEMKEMGIVSSEELRVKEVKVNKMGIYARLDFWDLDLEIQIKAWDRTTIGDSTLCHLVRLRKLNRGDMCWTECGISQGVVNVNQFKTLEHFLATPIE